MVPLVRLLSALALLGACAEAPPTSRSEPDPPTPGESTPADTDVTEDTGEEQPEEPPGPDCSELPPLPAPFHALEGFGEAEDFDFDGQGFHGSVHRGDLVARSRLGHLHVIAPHVGIYSGTRLLPSGDWVGNGGDQLVYVDAATGARHVVLGGLSYPNGLEVDRQGRAYVTEQAAGRIQRVDPVTLEAAVIAEGLANPNGVILSPDETTLYAVGHGSGHLYAIEQTAPDVWDSPRVLWKPPDGSGIFGAFDGLNVDVCGNLYVTEYGTGRVWRITPDGRRYDLVAHLPSSWIPNLRWGHGIGGWERDVLYVSDRSLGRIFGLELGIDGKKHVLAE